MLFLTVAALPASVLRTTVLASVYASEDFGADRGKIALESFEPGIEFLGFTADSLTKPDDFFLPVLPDAPITDTVSAVVLDIGGAPEAESPVLSIVRRMAALSMNPGVWLAAFIPAVWSVLIWRVRPPRRRRSRRHEYQRLLC